MIFIKHLPKDRLLFALWKEARIAPFFYYCPEKATDISLEIVTDDINNMINNSRDIDLTTYHSRLLYINITSDLVDVSDYNTYNGTGKAERVINELKKEELTKTIITYHKFF